MKRIVSAVILMTFILFTAPTITGLNEEEPPLFGTALISLSEEEPPLFGANIEANSGVTPDNEEEPPLF